MENMSGKDIRCMMGGVRLDNFARSVALVPYISVGAKRFTTGYTFVERLVHDIF